MVDTFLLSMGISGDIGLKNKTFETHVSNIKRHSLHGFMALGDNFYPSGVKSVHDPRWKTQIESCFPSPLFATLGNHDYLGDPSIQIQYTSSTWKMPHYYYDLIYTLDSKPFVHILFIDTMLLAYDRTKDLLTETAMKSYETLRSQLLNPQKQWMHEKLSKSRAPWKIVCGHYPCLSNGPHSVSEELRDFLLPLLKQYRVQFYFSGHNHNFQHIKWEHTHHFTSGSFSYQHPLSFHPLFPDTFFQTALSGWMKMSLHQSSISIEYINEHNEIIYSYSVFQNQNQN